MPWDSTFEASPSIYDESKYGAGKIRELKIAIREREELEHNFMAGSSPFHKAGKCSVLLLGTTIEIVALTGMTAGCIAFDTTLGKFKRYDGAAWEVLSGTHSMLSGLSDDDHIQYLNLAKAGQTLSEDLTLSTGVKIDGRDFSADYAALDSLIYTTSGVISVSFDSATKEIRRASGSFTTDGFADDDIIYTSSSINAGPFRITTISSTVLVVEGDIYNEGPVSTVILKTRRGFGAWGGAYSSNIVYGPEAEDCFISATSSTTTASGYVGDTSPPTTLIAYCWGDTGSGYYSGVVMPVRAGQYWKVLATGGVIKKMEVLS